MTAQTQVTSGQWAGQRLRVGVVVSRFNETLVAPLLQGALQTLQQCQVPPGAIDVAWVPGAFEVPQLARRLAQSGRYHAILCLGLVVRGATPHFDYIAGQAAAGVMQAGLHTGVPCIFGVLTCDSLEQALERCGTKAGNKGRDAALAAVEMANLFAQHPLQGD